MPIIKPVLGHYFIKYLSPNYFDLAAQIECDSCENFYSKEDICSFMKRSGVHGVIITDIKLPVGYIMWRQKRSRNTISVMNLVIREDYRRKGLATQLVRKLIGKFRKSNYRKGAFRSITCPVRETNLVARSFLTNFGFSCSGVLRDYYDDFGESEDAFNFYLTAYMSRKDNHVKEQDDGNDGHMRSTVSHANSVR